MAISIRRRCAHDWRVQQEAASTEVLDSTAGTSQPTASRKRVAKQPIRVQRRVVAPFASVSAPAGMGQNSPQPVMDLAEDSRKRRLFGLLPPKKGPELPKLPPALPPPPPWRVAAGYLASGAIAGCVVEAALYPLDTLKTRLQTMTSGGGLQALWKGGGGKALYAGIGGNLIGVAPASAIFMAFYEPTKAALGDRFGASASFLGAGAAAGLAASLVRVPTEVVKQRMQNGEFASARKAVSTIMRREGARGMFAGYGAFLLRDLPFDAIEFWAFDMLKLAAIKALDRDMSGIETGLCGAAAGAFTGLATTPLDVLKTRLMTQGGAAARGDVVYTGVLDCARKLYAEGGAKAFLRGWEPRVTWIAIGGSIFFGTLDYCKKKLVPEGAQRHAVEQSVGH